MKSSKIDKKRLRNSLIISLIITLIIFLPVGIVAHTQLIPSMLDEGPSGISRATSPISNEPKTIWDEPMAILMVFVITISSIFCMIILTFVIYVGLGEEQKKKKKV